MSSILKNISTEIVNLGLAFLAVALPVLAFLFLAIGAVGARVYFSRYGVDSNFILSFDDIIFLSTAGWMELNASVFVLYGIYIVVTISSFIVLCLFGFIYRQINSGKIDGVLIFGGAFIIPQISFIVFCICDILLNYRHEYSSPYLTTMTMLFIKSRFDSSFVVNAQIIPYVELILLLIPSTIGSFLVIFRSNLDFTRQVLKTISTSIIIVSAAIYPAAGVYYHLSNPTWDHDKAYYKSTYCNQDKQLNLDDKYLQNQFPIDVYPRNSAEVIWSSPKAVVLMCTYYSKNEEKFRTGTMKRVILNGQDVDITDTAK